MMTTLKSKIRNALDALYLGGYVEIHDGRNVAVAVFRAAQAARGLEAVDGGAVRDEATGGRFYFVTAELPACDRCGAEGGGGGPTGMCYQCETEAHAEGGFSMDSGRARAGRSDAEIHRSLEREGGAPMN
jgi:hypothetical protein